MKKWMEKEFGQWVYFDDEDGKIIGSVYKIGNATGIWGGKVYLRNNMEELMGQFIDSDFSRKSVERYWEIAAMDLILKYFGED
jgi:CTP:phosphocholine cytidylyltransferase-like protein